MASDHFPSDHFQCCDITTLVRWILAGEERGVILGLHRDLFFRPGPDNRLTLERYGRRLDSPLGVAAGPHTQLAQNIISAWLTGARYMELKTVQVLDELNVTKPCIDMADEGYNCEWSQELKLDQSFDEYLNAWIILHLLQDRMFGSLANGPGFIFNMSVGYNLEGILSPTVQRFLDRMADCRADKEEKIAALAAFYPRVTELDIPDCISDNITVSTMHGCPPDEVEKIGRYFIEERGLKTTIKLNPTLLGPERVRGILNDELGFPVWVPDLAFEHDLKYPDGVALIKALTQAAEENDTVFNLKLTNTLETSNRDQNLPDSEGMVYMSGRALHPISINLAARLQAEFNGKLDISFSAGVDCFNLARTIACGLKPVTVCSDILKPGGYGRLSQYLEELDRALTEVGARTIDDYTTTVSGNSGAINQAALANLRDYAARVTAEAVFARENHPYPIIRNERPLPKFDCAAAPCVTACPAGQEIPRYLDYTAQGRLTDALAVILATNPLPNVQGKVCDHPCQLKCTRSNYDQPLLIREIKRHAAERAHGTVKLRPGPGNGLSAAIIGGGPTGLTCAHYLALAGFRVDVFETKAFPGGMAADGIPVFRLDDGSLEKDIRAILDLGVNLHTSQTIDAARFNELRNSHDCLYIAVGAQISSPLDIPGIDAAGVIDQLDFLSRVRRGEGPGLGLAGARVAVIGGGNSAMDAARTALRLVGRDGEVTIVYRRTRDQMPADMEEIEAALREGIVLRELYAPKSVQIADGRVSGLKVKPMDLGPVDDSGRPRPVESGRPDESLALDFIIPAIGQRVELDFLPGGRLETRPGSLETGLDNVFAGGDAVRGASSLIKAIADGRRAAGAIIARAGMESTTAVSPTDDRRPDWDRLMVAQARRVPAVEIPEIDPGGAPGFDLCIDTLSPEAARAEAGRCLQCDIFCNVCTTVCPNRANLALGSEPFTIPVQTARVDGQGVAIETVDHVRVNQHFQIVNLADFCNECGNCTTFCPSAGSPFRDKPRFHLTRESFEASATGCLFSGPERMEIKNGDALAVVEFREKGYLYRNGRMEVELEGDLTAAAVRLIDPAAAGGPVNISDAAEAAALFRLTKDSPPFNLLPRENH